MTMAGWAMAALASVPTIGSGIAKLMQQPELVKNLSKGHLDGMIIGLGVLCLTVAILLLIPKTSPIGALLFAGYFGGAILFHLTTGDSIVFPLILGVVGVAGAGLRSPQRFGQLLRGSSTRPLFDAKPARIAGWVLTGLGGAMLVLSATGKFGGMAPVVELFGKLNIEGTRMTIGAVELLVAVLVLVPRTSVLGVTLATGYLGGAIVAHLIIGDPIVPPLVVGAFTWSGLFLRNRDYLGL